MTHQMAIDYELANRSKRKNPDSDGRSIWFQYHLELLRRVNDKWADQQGAIYATILEKHPYGVS